METQSNYEYLGGVPETKGEQVHNKRFNDNMSVNEKDPFEYFNILKR